MLSSLCFLVVNATLFIMLTGFMKEKGHIDFKFFVCLLFTLLGNATIGMSINTVISLVNVALGLYLYK